MGSFFIGRGMTYCCLVYSDLLLFFIGRGMKLLSRAKVIENPTNIILVLEY